MIDGHVAGDRHAGGPRGDDHLQGRRAGDARDMEAHARVPGELQQGGSGDGLGADGDPGQAQAGGHLAIVRHAAAGEIGVLRLQPDGKAEGCRVLQRPHQHLGVHHRGMGLAEGDAAGFKQLGHFRQALAGQAHGQRAHRIDVGEIRVPRPVLEHFHQARLIERRIRVGRAGEAGHAARGGGGHLRLQGGPILETGLAQPRREVDQAGADHQAVGLDDPVGMETLGRAADAGDLAGGDEQIALRVDAVGGIDEATVPDMDFHDSLTRRPACSSPPCARRCRR